MAQFGGGGPAFNLSSPGGLNFGSPAAVSNNTTTYYEIPLDANIKRLNDPTLNDPELSIEKRLEIFHNDLENDFKNSTLINNELNDLHRSDVQLRKTKILTEIGKNQHSTEEPKEKKYVAFEALLEQARTNDNSKHPFEDVNPPLEQPTRVHWAQTLYTNRGTGTTVFNPTTENERSPFNKARYTSPPDGNPRSYPYRDQHEIDEYLKNPEDVNFEHLYGETLTFNYPQDPETENKTGYKGIYEIFKKFLKKMKSKSMTHEQALAEWSKEIQNNMMHGPGGPGRRLDLYLGDTRDQFQEVMGVADKYPSSPISSVGGANVPWSST